MLPRETISTGPLVLRPPTEHDAEAIMRAANDPVTAHFLPLLPSPYTLEDAHAWIKKAGEGTQFAISGPEGGYQGAVGVTGPDRWGTCQIGYLVAPWARGQGIAARAARAVTDWAFDRGVARMELSVNVENLASVRAALSAGFSLEGVLRDLRVLRDGRRADHALFSRLPGDPGEPASRYLPRFDELTDGVVRLTPIDAGDAADFHALLSDPLTVRYSVNPVPPMDQLLRRCRTTEFWWATGQRVELAVRDAATGEFAGQIQLAQVVQPLDQAMVGYSLVPAFRGRGYMGRALGLLVDWAFRETALHRIVAGTDVANEASQRVLERAGFERVGVERELFPRPDGTRTDDVLWLRLRS
ncbi:GNAT family N-acetyltransferase [Nonomuraea sp. NPDC050328]|uniref:GNAT family N-acetyltransferase n=1 Tax=Nonomuraea sp. NPDC050328 TaxID=3364361 RepID=UPI0037BC2359